MTTMFLGRRGAGIRHAERCSGVLSDHDRVDAVVLVDENIGAASITSEFYRRIRCLVWSVSSGSGVNFEARAGTPWRICDSRSVSGVCWGVRHGHRALRPPFRIRARGFKVELSPLVPRSPHPNARCNFSQKGVPDKGHVVGQEARGRDVLGRGRGRLSDVSPRFTKVNALPRPRRVGVPVLVYRQV